MKKNRNLEYSLLLLTLVFFVLIISSGVFANSSSINKESKNKFDPMLISYLQNESLIKAPSTKGVGVQILEESKIPVIIRLYDRGNMEDVYATLSQNGANIKFSFELIDAIAADVPASIFESLSTNEHIKKIYLDRKIQIPAPDITFEKKFYELNRKIKNREETTRQITPKLYESTKLINAPFMWDLGIDGSGVKIAILDTGIDDTHPDLASKVIAKRDFTLFDNELRTEDGFGHGTHVAGIAAGSGVSALIYINTSSTDTSNLTNLPSQWAMDSPFNLIYHIGNIKYSYLWSEGYYVVGKSAAKINGVMITDDFFDFPHDWEINNNLTSVEIIQLDGCTLRVEGNESEITHLTIDGESKSGTNTLTWCNTTVVYSTGVNGSVKIVMNYYNVVYMDTGDFAPPVARAFKNTSLEDEYGGIYYWFFVDISENGNSIVYGYDRDYDREVDIFKGVAPGADLMNGKVLSDYGYGYDSSIIAGIEWAVLNGADIISMSLGGWQNICDGNDPLSEAVEKASDMGVTVVVAAGNSGYWGQETLDSPGCANKIITVGASSKYGYDLYIAPFSSQGPTADGRIKPEVLAPGVSIIAPQANGTQMSLSPFPGYVSASGTSMATPHVAGAAALLKQMDNSLTPEEIKKILMNTATDLVGESIFREGAGIINMSKAYDAVSNSKNLASHSVLNLILKNTETKIVQLNTTLTNPILSAVKDELNYTISDEFTGQVNQTDGFVYNFTIGGGTVLFMVYINWINSSNDIDMILRNPAGDIYGWSAWGDTNYEYILVENPETGTWSLEVYPWYVTETVEVYGSLYLENLIQWGWFSYNDATNELTIDSNEEESDLYAGKLTLTSNNDSTMIPTSIILSEPIEFSGIMNHSYISDPCNGGGVASGGWSSSGSSTESYASFDGYFCNDLERKAYSFSIPTNAPYFDIFIDWWIPSSSTYGDIRMFIYDPEGNLYDSIDYYGEFESAHIYNPIPGDWTVVVESEYVLEEGILFEGDVTIPSIIFDPDYIWLTLGQGEETTKIINVTNTLNYDLDFSVEKTIWQEIPLAVTPNSDIDNNSLGPFIYSYRYYNFYVPPEYISSGKYLKSLISLEENSFVYRIGVYIFDADGVFVDYVYDYFSDYLSSYHYIPTLATSGNWTIVVFVDGFYSDEYPFNVDLWLLDNIEWNWVQVTEPPSFFQGTENMSLDISVPQNISIGNNMAALYMNGGWWQGDPSYRTLYRSLSTMYPITITVINASVEPEYNTTMPNWTLTITATNQLEPVTFGVNSLATDSYDATYDVFTQTPIQNRVIMSLDDIYATDIKDPYGVKNWTLNIGVPAGQSTIISWDLTGLSSRINLTIYNASKFYDMRLVNSLELGEGQHTFLIKANLRDIVEFNLNVSAGWNMISLPLVPENNSAESLFEDCISTLDIKPIVKWQSPLFVPATELNSKTGYWLFSPTSTICNISGLPIENTTLSLIAGWNIVGTVSDLSNLNISLIPNQVDIRPAVTWQSPLFVETTITEPGKSAWVFVTQDTEVEI